MSTTRRTLDPKLDIVFKLLFGRAENRELLISLLQAVIRPSSPIRSVEVQSALDPAAVGDKAIALDLRVELDSREQIDVEMQTYPRPARRPRTLYYWARLYSDQLRRGQGYEQLRRCVVVFILAYPELPGDRFHSTFRVMEVHDHEEFSDHLELHLLELPKLASAVAANDEPGLLAWGKFLSAGSDEELEELAMSNPVLNKAKAALERLSEDPDARVLAEMRDMALESYRMEIATARSEGKLEGRAEGKLEGRAEGKLEGRAEGKLEGKAELLFAQLVEKYGAVPASIRERVAGARGAELELWARRILKADSLDALFSD